MIWIISMDKERHVQRQAFPSGQALRDFANGAPYSWYEQKVLLVTEDRLVLYSSMGRQKGTKKMQMQDVLAWYLDALGEGRADATYARLTGAREIQEGDFCLAEDAADWSPSPDGAGECWVYHLTPGCNVDEVLDRLDLAGVRFTLVTLTCSRQALEARLQSDISRKRRSPGVLSRSLERLPLYADMGGVVVDTSAVTAEEAARRIARMFIKV